MCSSRSRGRMCPAAPAGRKRRDVPQEKDCPFCSLLPAQPVLVLNLGGENTSLVEGVGGLKKMLKWKHVCVFLALKKWQSASFGDRGNLCGGYCFLKVCFYKCVLLAFLSEQKFLGLKEKKKKKRYNYRQGSASVLSLRESSHSWGVIPALVFPHSCIIFSGLPRKNRKESWLYKARIEITYPVLTVVYCRGLKFVL